MFTAANIARLTQSGLFINHRIYLCLSHRIRSCWYSVDADRNDNTFTLSKDACPQGIQGDDCVTFKLWLESCRRYGLGDCNYQLQGIQSGRKTLSEVIAEQDKLVAEIAAQYRAASQRDSTQSSSHQSVQDSVTTSLDVDTPCPQGVQGSDCASFKLWLENCHRFGLQDNAHQFESFKAGRKTLVEIFSDQDQMIRTAAADVIRKASNQKRSYSTSAKINPEIDDSIKPDSPEEKPLTQRQKLQRAVKEYGSTVIVFHVTISLVSLGFFYLLVSSGIDVVGLLMKLDIGGSLLQNKLAAGTGTFVVAYAVHKVFAPVRIATTLTATPFIVRYLRKINFLKVPQHSKSK